jgi:hypothetical protein
VPSSNHNVSVGLRFSSLGLWAVATAAVLALGISLLTALTRPTYYGIYGYQNEVTSTVLSLTNGAMYGCLAAAGVGLVLGAFGRYCCLRVTTGDGTATARIKLATVLEVSSLLSGAALVGVSWLGAKVIGPLPPIIEVTWALFTGIAAYTARVQFHLFLRTLAAHFAPPQVAEVKAVSRMYLYVPGAFVLALGVFAAGEFANSRGEQTLAEAGGRVLAWLIATAATVFGLFMVWRWAGLVASLRTAAALAARHEEEVGDDNDPDAEYRRRYHAAGHNTMTPPPARRLESAQHDSEGTPCPTNGDRLPAG